MLLVLVPLLLAPLCWTTVAPAAGPRCFEVQARAHHSSLLRFKCDSLLYRSIFSGNDCFFAINKPVIYTDGAELCKAAFNGSKIYTANGASSVLSAMHLNAADYHSESTFYSDKSVLCRYANPFSCNSDESTAMPGRCMKKFDRTMSFRDGSTHCKERGSRLPAISNDEENGAVAKIAAPSSTPSWVDQAVIEGQWRAAVSERVDYFHWHFGKSASLDLQCSEEQAVTVASAANGGCMAYSYWELAEWKALRQVICVRPSDSAFHTQPSKDSGGDIPTLPPLSTTTSTTTTTTTTEKTTTTTTTALATTTRTIKPLEPKTRCKDKTRRQKTTTTTKRTKAPTTTTTVKKIVYPPNNPPQVAWTWNLNFYYNFGRILHGYCADNTGCSQMFSNGVGYDRSSGSGNIGRTISRDGMNRMREVCSENYMKLVPLHFQKTPGHAYIHNFGSGIYVGHVATTWGHCGAKVAIKYWGCMFSTDLMYGINLEWNTYYKGRVRNGNQPVFYLW